MTRILVVVLAVTGCGPASQMMDVADAGFQCGPLPDVGAPRGSLSIPTGYAAPVSPMLCVLGTPSDLLCGLSLSAGQFQGTLTGGVFGVELRMSQPFSNYPAMATLHQGTDFAVISAAAQNGRTDAASVPGTLVLTLGTTPTLDGAVCAGGNSMVFDALPLTVPAHGT